MTAHKHAEMIKAKADNMELVVFCKDSYDDANKWQETSQMPFQEEFDYFLCLPKHKESCLHWLNGGDVLVKSKFVTSWEVVFHGQVWGDTIGWMREDAKYRIKPRKEKRHIYISTLGATTYAKKTKEEAAREVNIMGGSFDVWKHYEIEIEVEV